MGWQRQDALRHLRSSLVALAEQERELDALRGRAGVAELYPVAVQRARARARVEAQRARLDALLRERYAGAWAPRAAGRR
jgi:hypothetical protein